MNRKIGTVSRGIRCPIIRQGDDLAQIVVTSVLEAAEQGGYSVQDRDVVGITESVVARAQGNYASVDDIAADIRAKFGGEEVGVILPILSRNRFAICLRGIAKGVKKVVLMLSYPSDEVGNELVSLDQLDEAGIDPFKDVLTAAQFREKFGDSRHPFIFISLAAVLNLILDVVFVVVFRMGAGGAALATIISQGVSFITCTCFLIRHRAEYKLNITLRHFVQWDQSMLLSLIKLVVPMAIKSASVMVSKLFVNSFINAYGVAVSAFAGIANKLSSVSMLVSNAMNTAGSTVVGQNLAAGKFDRVKKILLRIAYITLSMAALFSLVIILFPEQIFGIFTADAAVMQIARGYIPIAVLLFFGAAMRAIMNALINGSGHTKINFATAILDGIVMRIGLAVLFGLVMHMEYTGFWLGDALAGFTPFFIGLVFYVTGAWKKQALKKA